MTFTLEENRDSYALTAEDLNKITRRKEATAGALYAKKTSDQDLDDFQTYCNKQKILQLSTPDSYRIPNHTRLCNHNRLRNIG